MDQTGYQLNINLDDYDYQRDVNIRLFFNSLTPNEIEVLREIVDNSLMIPILELSNYLEIQMNELLVILRKLSPSNLFYIDGDSLIVNKEKRKYIETEILKFEKGFKPDISYFLTLLNKLPIEVLPTWYSVSQYSENITHSILQQIFITPKAYQTHLQSVSKKDQILNEIVKIISHSPLKKIESSKIKEHLNLEDHEFHQHIIQLEFYMACCLTYEIINDTWTEYVSLCNEWQQFLNWQDDRSPDTIKELHLIKRYHNDDFGFIHDISTLLNYLQEGSVNVTYKNLQYHLDHTLSCTLFKGIQDSQSLDAYVHDLIEFCLNTNLCKLENTFLHPLPLTQEWLSKPPHELATSLHRLIGKENIPGIEKNLREIEKSLQPLCSLGWVFFDDYLNSLIRPIGNAKPVQLTKAGNRWSYSLPYYDAKDKEFINYILCKRLFQAGIVALGTVESKLCFCLTTYGKSLVAHP